GIFAAAAVVGRAGDEVAVDGERAAAAAVLGLGAGALPAGGLVDAVERIGHREARAGAAAIGVTAIGRAGVLDLDRLGRQLVEEARRDRRLPEAVDTPVLRHADAGALPGAGDADIGEAAFFLGAGAAQLVHGAL